MIDVSLMKVYQHRNGNRGKNIYFSYKKIKCLFM